MRFDFSFPVGDYAFGRYDEHKLNIPFLKEVASSVNRYLCFTCPHIQKKGKVLLVRTSIESFELVLVGLCKKFVFLVLHDPVKLYITSIDGVVNRLTMKT